MLSTIWGNAFAKSLRAKSRMRGSEWAEKHRYVAPGTSPEPGPWRNSRVPYLIEPMDMATSAGVETLVMMCSSQVAKSEFLLNVMGYYADQEPAPQLMLVPTVEAAESFSKERIDPTFKYTEVLRDKMEVGEDGRGSSRKSSDTIRMKHYPGGYVAMVGSNSPAGLASRPIRVLLVDEVDRCQYTKEGDSLKLAIQRTTNFHNKKICLVSTPTTVKESKIYEWFLKSDQRYYQVPCPHCGATQRLVWKQVKWLKNKDGASIPETAYYECQHCAGHIRDVHKFDMLAAGYWEATNPNSKIVGYHLNSLYSPWVKLESLVREWVDIHATKDKKGLMEFINLKLGEPWEEKDDDFNWEHLHRRRQYYNADIPMGGLLLTAGLDTQDEWVAAEVVAWGKDKESWGVEYRIFMGDTSQATVWKEVDEYLQRQWTHESGLQMPIMCACIDSRGHRTTEVYTFTKAREARRVFSIRGMPGDIPFVGKPNKNNKIGAHVFNIGVGPGKANIMARVRIEDEGPGYCHWPRAGETGYDAEYFKGLLAEKMIFKYVNGKTVSEWKKIYERNEPLDCRNYATAAMEILNPNFELLEKQILEGGGKAPPPKQRQSSGKRVLSRGIS